MAGTFQSDFNSGLPSSVSLYGSAAPVFAGTGAIRLVSNANSQSGSIIVSAGNTAAVTTFDTTVDVFAGNAANAAQPADGYSLAWGAVPGADFGEEGPASFTGLVVSFDYYINAGAGETAREVTVNWNGSQVGRVAYDAYTNSSVPVHVRLRQGGLLDVWHNGNRLFNGLTLPNFAGISSPKLGLGARTGGATAEVRIDNLRYCASPIMVTNVSNSGTGSLRQALADALSASGPDQIHFDASLNGQTINLTGSGLTVGNQTVAIDASSLSSGIAISGSNAVRTLNADSSSGNVLLNRLFIKNGLAPGAGGTEQSGGGLRSEGALDVIDCSFSGCSAVQGGAVSVWNAKTASFTRCSFYDNTANVCGGLFSILGPTISLTRCSFYNNKATAGYAGALQLASGSAALLHCTLSGNSATSGGGGIAAIPGASIAITNSILAGNTGGSLPDIALQGGSATLSGVNIIGATDSSGPASMQVGAPNAAGHYIGSSGSPLSAGTESFAMHGGLTPTILLAETSVARDKATTTSSTTDQRGFGVFGALSVPDIGAVEAQIGAFSDETTSEDTPKNNISLLVGALGTLTASSSNTTLLDSAGIVITGTGTERLFRFTPKPDQFGATEVTVTDSLTGESSRMTLTVLPENDPPSFSKGPDVHIAHEDGLAYYEAGWATSISAGPGESSASLTFLISTDNNALFTVLPTISSTGELTFHPASGVSGEATVTARLQDAEGGLSEPQTFKIRCNHGWSADFSTPTAAKTYGSAALANDHMQLVAGRTSQLGACIVPSFTGTRSVTLFDVTAKIATSDGTPNGPADGYSFAWGSFSDAAFGEDGPAGISGLVVSFDYYINYGEGETARDVTVKWNGTQIGRVEFDAYTNSTERVHIRLRHGGLLDVWHGSNRLFSGLTIPGFTGLTSPKWGFGARTGGAVARVAIDELAINTTPLLVTNPLNAGAGSLRQALADADSSLNPGANQVHFSSSLDTALILLQTAINPGACQVLVDGSTLPTGITIISSATDGIITGLASDGYLMLHQLTLSGSGQSTSNQTSGVKFRGYLELRDTTLTNFSTQSTGAAVGLSGGKNFMDGCTFSNNTAATGGGAIYVAGSTELKLTRCTLSGNSAPGAWGGAILNIDSPLQLTHCTLSGNSAATGGGLLSAVVCTVNYCVIAGNSATTRPDLGGLGATTTASMIGGDPKLGPLGTHGGKTRTMLPLTGSPLLNAATGSASNMDQRGYPTLGVAEIGAVESQFSPIADVTTTEDSSALLIGYAVGSVGTLTATSGNTALITTESLNFLETPGQRHLAVPLQLNANGTSTITIADPATGDAVSFLVVVAAVNDPPTFTAGGDVQSYMSTAETISQPWAADISAGPADEQSQALSFTVTTNNASLFSQQPSISANGTLSYSLAPSMLGEAVVFVTLQDDGGANSSSETKLFVVKVMSGFTTDFNALPSGVTLYNNATLNSARVRLISASSLLEGSLIVSSFTGNTPVTTFDVTADVTTGGAVSNNPGDGYSFAWGDVPAGSFGEDGPADFTGLVVSFDYFINVGEPYREVSVLWKGSKIGSVNYNAYTNSTVPLHIRLRHGGLLDVWHDGNRLFSNLQLPQFSGMAAPRWGFGARAGSRRAAVSVDSLTINATPFIATNTNDSGSGSLRQALSDAGYINAPGANQIHFSGSLSGQRMELVSLLSIGAQSVCLDASMLPGGLTLSTFSEGSLISNTGSAGHLMLHRLTLTRSGQSVSHLNYAFTSTGILELRDTTITGCHSGGAGGGLRVTGGKALADRCTFSANHASSGGFLYASGSGTSVVFNRCTFSGNVAGAEPGGAGAISSATVLLNHCTVNGNQSFNSGGAFSLAGGKLTLQNSIVAGNSAPFAGNIVNFGGTLALVGGNVIDTDPKLGPLGSYGGHTQTMAPLAGSPARNAAVGSTDTSDQRSFPIVGIADIGAYEAGTNTSYAAWMLENSTAPLLPSADDDADGRSNRLEYALRSDPLAADASASPSKDAAGLHFNYRPEATDLRYSLQRSSDLANWETLAELRLNASGAIISGPMVLSASAQSVTVTDSDTSVARRFWRLAVNQE